MCKTEGAKKGNATYPDPRAGACVALLLKHVFFQVNKKFGRGNSAQANSLSEFLFGVIVIVGEFVSHARQCFADLCALMPFLCRHDFRLSFLNCFLPVGFRDNIVILTWCVVGHTGRDIWLGFLCARKVCLSIINMCFPSDFTRCFARAATQKPRHLRCPYARMQQNNGNIGALIVRIGFFGGFLLIIVAYWTPQPYSNCSGP